MASSDSSESRLSTKNIRNIIDQLEHKRHRDSTQCTYYIVWKKFNEFFIKFGSKPQEWEDHLVLFTAYLVDKGFKSSTIKSYISAIKSVLADLKIKLDVDQSKLNSLTKACRLNNDRISTRLPIHKGLLQLILDQIHRHYYNRSQIYLATVYQALFITAYYGLFRVGELTHGPHAILARNVHIALNKCKMLFILEMSKTHTKGNKPQLVKITRVSSIGEQPKKATNQAGLIYSCPFDILQHYLLMRPQCRENNQQFFVFADSSPIFPSHMRNCLRIMLRNLNLNPKLYCTHSMRIGRSCDLLKCGVSVETIKKLGRWKSNAIFRYLRC